MSVKICLLAEYPDAADRLAEWYFQQWGPLLPLMSQQDVACRVREGAQESGVPIAILARDHGKTIGAAELKYRQPNAYPHWNYWLDGVFVLPEYRGQGIASKLVQRILEIARDQHIEQLYLRTEQHNLALYEKLGFHVVAREGAKFIMSIALTPH